MGPEQNELQEGETSEDNALNDESQGDSVDNYDIQENEDGSATLIPKEDQDPTDEQEQEFYQNLVEIVSDHDLRRLSSDYIDFIEVDKKAREKRDAQYAEAIQRTGLGDEAPGGADFDGANKVTHPLISEATVDFAARAIKELCPPDGPVKSKIIGKSTPEKFRKADRKTRHMNWQLMTQMPEYRPCLEQILTQAALSGVQYSKRYHWKRGRRSKFEYVPMDDIYVPFHAPNFYSASRKTHCQKLTQLDFEERVSSGLYFDYDIGDRTDPAINEITKSEEASRRIEGKEDPMYDDDGLRTVYEVYCWLELDEDAIAEGDYKYAPYIMSIDGPTEKILSIYRNWDQNDPTMAALDWIIEWSFVPWRGAYAIGLGHLIGSLGAAATGALRALLDSAHINNAPTAIKLKGAQFGGQSESISITQIHEIEAAPGVDDIRKIAMPLPFNPPSSVLLDLLGIVVEYGKGVVRTSIEADKNYSPNTPVGTEMSRVDQGMAVYSSIHARMHESVKRDLAIQHRLNAMYLEENKTPEDPAVAHKHSRDADDETSIPLAFKEDYEGEMDVQPVSDPNIFSEVQRFSQMQSVGQLIMQAPQLYDQRAYHKRMLQLMKVPGIDELMPEPPQPEDENPATENIKMAFGQPAFVLPHQDHLAHLQVLIDFMKDPCYGQNPAIKLKFLKPAIDHAVQHLLFLYGDEVKQLIEQASGQPIKQLMSEDPQLKELMSKTVAAASPTALENTQGLLKGIMPVLQQAVADLQKMMPPPPMDPAVATLQAKQIDAKTDAAKQAQDAKSDAAKQQQDAAAAAQEDQTKKEIAMAQLQSEESLAKLKAATEVATTQQDNQTAIDIAEMRVVTGGSTGGLKDGASLGHGISE